MKYFLTLLFLILFKGIILSQNITIKTLETLKDSKFNKIENWAISNGFSYLRTENNNKYSLIYYEIKNINSLIIWLKEDGTISVIDYQTKKSDQYLKLKNSCSNNGYKFIKTEKTNPLDEKSGFGNLYENSKYQLFFYTNNTAEYFGYAVSITEKETR